MGCFGGICAGVKKLWLKIKRKKQRKSRRIEMDLIGKTYIYDHNVVNNMNSFRNLRPSFVDFTEDEIILETDNIKSPQQMV